MVIYEVNLQINRDIFPDFISWLRLHVEHILTLPGFIKALYLKEQITDDIDIQTLSIQYYLDSQASLDNYFENHAEAMRDDGLVKFPNQFSATRRIFTVQDEVLRS
jgi:hypothetical protein